MEEARESEGTHHLELFLFEPALLIEGWKYQRQERVGVLVSECRRCYKQIG